MGGAGEGPTSARASAAPPRYSTAVLSDQPAAYWRLDDPANGGATDASAHGQVGVLIGGVVAGVPGPIGDATAMAFDGNNGAVKDTTSLTVGPDFSIEAWVKASPGASGPIVSVDSGDTRTRMLYVEQGHFWGRQDNSQNWPASAVMSSDLDPTTWHHVVFVSEGTATLTLYVDGATSGSASVAPTDVPFTAIAALGTSTSAPWMGRFAGALTNVALYTQALSASQVQAHYQAALTSGCGRPLPALLTGSPLTAAFCR